MIQYETIQCDAMRFVAIRYDTYYIKYAHTSLQASKHK